ncbi:MAG: PQQ-binding-like beta-propeller repeat protein [Acidobacteria bacterium]|nr:PQQ-binding-like beta-propeller repeat protein [Acidobacteriota bacterium]
MTTNHTDEPTSRKPLRLWPGVVAALLLILVRFVLPVVAPEAQFFGTGAPLIAVMGGLFGATAVAVWWVFFSRAPWSERLGAIGVMIVAIVVTRPLTHISIQNGMMGMMFVIYAVPPTLSLALVGWAVISRRLSEGPRRLAMVAAILIGCVVWTLVRTDGILDGAPELAWRWTPTAEERLLAQEASGPKRLPSPPPAATSAPTADKPVVTPSAPGTTETTPSVSKPAVPPSAPATTKIEPTAPAGGPAMSGEGSKRVETPAMSERGFTRVEWPGFRGAGRDGIVRGVRIATDWSASPPVEMWRRPIGPGWSSFAVSGDFLYTQEQRGDDEIVACYNVSTGEPVWMHRDATRFWESNGGAGPRATPALHNGRVYAFGATGILNALDARNGAVMWSRNVQSDTGRKVPDWGFASSPLVIDDVVIVAAAGTLAAYDLGTGNRRWSGPSYGGSYSSPHRATIDGVVQVLLLGGPGAISVAPATGAVLWQHAWAPGPIVQPALTADGDVLINAIAATGGMGTRRLAVTHGSEGWSVQERWTSNGLKPYFNDFVVHKGHAFGFDGNILASIDLEDGTRKWKGGRYGNGQLVLLPDQDLLLVLSEDGELALVSATPDKFTEIARFPVFEGKTWNHPVLVGDVLLVRNGEEMAAFRLSPASR